MKDGEYTVKPQANVMNILTIPLTDKEIVDQAITKAEANSGKEIGWLMQHMPEDLPYLQDFAKALWGEKRCLCGNPAAIAHSVLDGGAHRKVTNSGWQHHLQMMVIADNPIQYLKENI